MRFAPRWRIAGLLFVVAALNYLDRAAISIASPAIKADLGVSSEQMGLVFSGFFAGYALFNFFGGWAADRYGPRRVLAVSLIAWSLFCAMTAAAQGFLSLMALRIFFGAAEGPMGATGAKVVSRWFPKREVSSAIAAAASGTPVGAVVAGPLVALLIAWLGWRGALVAVSCLGVAFALVWLRYASDAPPSVPRSEDGASDSTFLVPRPGETRGPEVAERTTTRESPPPGSTSNYFLRPVILANAVAYFAYTYLLSIYLSWLPLYFTSERHLELVSAALGSSIPWIMGFVGIWVGGLSSDLLFRSTGRLLFSRRCTQVGGLLIAGSGTALLGWTTTTQAAIAVVALSLFALYVAGTSFWAIVQDVVPSKAVGRISGFTHLIANIGGIVGPAATGAIVQRTASFDLAWLTAGVVAVSAAVTVIVVARFEGSDRTA